MGPTRIRELVVGTVISAIIGYLVLHRWIPPITVWTGLSLLVFAAAEAGWAFYVRSKIASGEIGDLPGRLHPLAVAKSVAVAKASAWVGTVALGWWIGVVAYLVPLRGELQAASDGTAGAVVAGVSALALVIAGVWLQHCCRSPDDPPEDPDDAMD
jgi:hypothetical protein